MLCDLGPIPSSIFKISTWKNQRQLNMCFLLSPFPVVALLFLLRAGVAPESLLQSFRAASFSHPELAWEIQPPGHPAVILSPFPFYHSLVYIDEHGEELSLCSPWTYRLVLTTSHGVSSAHVAFSGQCGAGLRVKATAASTSGILLLEESIHFSVLAFVEPEA